MSVYSEHIDFLPKVEARLGNDFVRNRIVPTNGSTFTSNSDNMQFQINGMERGAFADLQNMYLVCTVNNNDASSSFDFVGDLGSQALVKKLTVETSDGVKFSELDNHNVLQGMINAEKNSTQYRKNQGAVMFGMDDNKFAGSRIAAGGTQRVIIPFGLTGLASSSYYPLCAKTHLKFQIDLESAIVAVIGVTDAALASTEISLTNVECYYNKYKMDEQNFQNLLEDIGGKFIINTVDYSHYSEIIPAASTSTIANLGTSKRNVEAVYACLRTNSIVTGTDSQKNALTSRNQAKVSEFKLMLNGITVGNNAVNVDITDCAESMAELMIANGGLAVKHVSALGDASTGDNYVLEEGTATSTGTCGSYFMKQILNNGFQGDLSYSGINTQGTGLLQFEITKGASTADQRLDVYLKYHSRYELDMMGDQMWAKYS